MSTTKEPDYKAILFALCASFTLADNMGDVFEDVFEALLQAGVPKSELDNVEEPCDFVQVLPSPVKTLYGSILDEED